MNNSECLLTNSSHSFLSESLMIHFFFHILFYFSFIKNSISCHSSLKYSITIFSLLFFLFFTSLFSYTFADLRQYVELCMDCYIWKWLWHVILWLMNIMVNISVVGKKLVKWKKKAVFCMKISTWFSAVVLINYSIFKNYYFLLEF